MNFRNLHLLLVGPIPPPAGGMANQTRQLFELLTAEGAQVELLPTNPPYRPAWVGKMPFLRAVARLLVYIPTLWFACGRNKVIHVMANSGWSWHLFAAPAVLIGRLRGLRVVVNYRGGGAEAFLAGHILSVKPVLNQAHFLAVPSGFLKEVFIRYGFKPLVVPNIVDLSRFAPQFRNPRAAPHLIVTRHLEAIYDNATAIRAFAMVRQSLPAARLTIAGIGPERDRLRQLAHELRVSDAVTFSGHLDRDGMMALYRSADILINASLADNMPNSVLEAMASGIAVISTRVGGVPWIVEDGVTGLLVSPGDAGAMSANVLELWRDDRRRAVMVEAALTAVGRFRWSAVSPLLAAAYCSE